MHETQQQCGPGQPGGDARILQAVLTFKACAFCRLPATQRVLGGLQQLETGKGKMPAVRRTARRRGRQVQRQLRPAGSRSQAARCVHCPVVSCGESKGFCRSCLHISTCEISCTRAMRFVHIIACTPRMSARRVWSTGSSTNRCPMSPLPHHRVGRKQRNRSLRASPGNAFSLPFVSLQRSAAQRTTPRTPKNVCSARSPSRPRRASSPGSFSSWRRRVEFTPSATRSTQRPPPTSAWSARRLCERRRASAGTSWCSTTAKSTG